MSDQPVYYKQCPECLSVIQHDEYNARKEYIDDKGNYYNTYLKRVEARKKSALFPAPLRTWNRHCPEHQAGLERDASYIAKTRLIPFDWFDVYDAEGYHLCRACGAELRTKKGKRCAAQRWCKRKDEEHKKWVHETFLNFPNERWDYVCDLSMKQIPLIEEKFPGKIKSGELILNDGKRRCSSWSYYQFKQGHVAVICEQCGELCTFTHSHCYGVVFAQVHHKNPVCHTTAATIMSIFDHANFILLCMSCHGKSHPWRKRPDPPSPKYLKLDDFLK